MDNLDRLRQPVSVDQVRQIVYAALRDDKRYADFKRDFIKNPDMDINLMKAHLLEAARECGDLVGEVQTTSRLAKKALEMVPSGTGGLELDHARQGGKGGRGGGKGGKGQHPHPQPKGTGVTSDAGGAVQTRDDRTRNNKQLCTSFLYGNCRKGDACTRSHVSLAAIAAEVAK